MVRSAMISFALLLVPAASFAQVSTGRVIREAVIVEQPRGDSAVLATVPPGIVLELLALQGDWYSVAIPPSGTSTERTGVKGWINRAAVEPLPGRVPGEAAGQADTSPTPTARWFSFRQGIRPQATELSFQGAFTVTNFGDGLTTSTLQVDGFGGYFVAPKVEIGAIASFQKVTGGGPIGQIGPAAAYNISPSQPFNGFVGGAFGWGFGLSPVNPTFFQVYGGVRAMVPGGGGALIVRPFWQHDFFSSGGSVNLYGVAFGVAIFL